MAEPVLAPHPLERVLSACQTDGLIPNMRRWLRFRDHQPGDIVEIQALHVRDGRGANRYAFARSEAEAIELAGAADGRFQAQGIFTILNRLDPVAGTRVDQGKWHDAIRGSSTTDKDIADVLAVFIDGDVVRPRGTSATDAQVAASAAVMVDVHAWLAAQLGEEPLAYAHSGNGRQIYVALDHLEPGPETTGLVRALLVGLSARYSTRTIKIDPVVSDAKRLAPAFGTWKRKGAATIPEYPHRPTSIMIADDVRRIGRDELRALVQTCRSGLDEAGMAAVDKELGLRRQQGTNPPTSGKRRVAQPSGGPGPYQRGNLVAIEDVAAWVGVLEGDVITCPGCGATNADGTSVAFVSNGLKCSHASCARVGPPGFQGYRTPVDLVAEVKRIDTRDAVTQMAERFGFEGFRERQAPDDDWRPEETPPPDGEVDGESNAAGEVEPETPKPDPWTTWPSLASIIRALGDGGPRVPTGILALDKMTRGGIPLGKAVVLVGAPGAGKTGLSIQFSRSFLAAGCFVGVYAADEEDSGLAIRYAQQLGFSRDLLEDKERGTDERERAAEQVEGLPYLIVDADKYDVTLEQFFAAVEAMRGDRPSAVIIDSVQTARTDGGPKLDGPRARVNDVMSIIKVRRKRGNHLVAMTSEMSRSGYAARRPEDRANPLAAGKESSDIEYGAHIQLALYSLPKADDGVQLIDVMVPKNRLGTKDDFRLRYEAPRCSFDEVGIDAAPKKDKFADAGEKIAAYLRENPDSAWRRIRVALKGIDNAVLDEAWQDLQDADRVVNLGSESRPRWRVKGEL